MGCRVTSFRSGSFAERDRVLPPVPPGVSISESMGVLLINSTKPLQIVYPDSNRLEYVIENQGVVIVYAGTFETVTTGNGLPLLPYRAYKSRSHGALWLIAASGTEKVPVAFAWENRGSPSA